MHALDLQVWNLNGQENEGCGKDGLVGVSQIFEGRQSATGSRIDHRVANGIPSAACDGRTFSVKCAGVRTLRQPDYSHRLCENPVFDPQEQVLDAFEALRLSHQFDGCPAVGSRVGGGEPRYGLVGVL